MMLEIREGRVNILHWLASGWSRSRELFSLMSLSTTSFAGLSITSSAGLSTTSLAGLSTTLCLCHSLISHPPLLQSRVKSVFGVTRRTRASQADPEVVPGLGPSTQTPVPRARLPCPDLCRPLFPVLSHQRRPCPCRRRRSKGRGALGKGCHQSTWRAAPAAPDWHPTTMGTLMHRNLPKGKPCHLILRTHQEPFNNGETCSASRPPPPSFIRLARSFHTRSLWSQRGAVAGGWCVQRWSAKVMAHPFEDQWVRPAVRPPLHRIYDLHRPPT